MQMKMTATAPIRPAMAKHLRNGILFAVLFAFVAWSLHVALSSFDTLSDLTLAGALNEAIRAAIFVWPVWSA